MYFPTFENRILYRGRGKFGKFGESSSLCQTNLVATIDNLLANLFIRQTFFATTFAHLLSPNIIAAKLSRYTDTIWCNIWQCKNLTNAAISDLDKENLTNVAAFQLSALILLLHALVAVITTPSHVAHTYLVMTFLFHFVNCCSYSIIFMPCAYIYTINS